LLGHVADVIAHAKFCDNRFSGFGVLIPPILPFSIGIAGHPYNSVSTTVLHCDEMKPKIQDKVIYRTLITEWDTAKMALI